MTMSITIKRDTSGAEHEAEVRVDGAVTNTLKAGEEVSVNIWAGRRLEVREVSKATPDGPAEPILQFFAYDHLPAHLAAVSKPFGDLAGSIVLTLPRNAERTVALRKLLESKDAAVRALLAKS